MILDTTRETQRFYARLAGFMYLLNYATVVPGAMGTSWIRGGGEFAEQAARVAGSEHLYRAALASMAVSWVVLVVLAYALYITLRPVNKRIAAIALFLDAGHAIVGAVTVMFSFGVLRAFVMAAQDVTAAPSIQPIATVMSTASNAGFNVALLFLGVASVMFFYLFYKSAYLPKALAGFGVLAAVLFIIGTVGLLVAPEYGAINYAAWAPMGLAEVTIALWLAIKGIRVPLPATAG
jgi:hypothetical protein